MWRSRSGWTISGKKNVLVNHFTCWIVSIMKNVLECAPTNDSWKGRKSIQWKKKKASSTNGVLNSCQHVEECK